MDAKTIRKKTQSIFFSIFGGMSTFFFGSTMLAWAFNGNYYSDEKMVLIYACFMLGVYGLRRGREIRSVIREANCWPGEESFVTRRRRGAFWSAAVAAAAYAWFFPVDELPHLFFLTLVVGGVYELLAPRLSVEKVIPAQALPIPEEKPEPEPEPKKQEKPHELSYTEQLRQLKEAIPDKQLSQQINRIAEITGKIQDLVREKPEKQTQVRRFMDYYLPTTLKLLRTYSVLDQQNVEGENIRSAMEKVENMMDTVVKAFEKQLDLLFQDTAMDVSADISVLENVLAQEGLTGGMLDLKEFQRQREPEPIQLHVDEKPPQGKLHF